MAAFIVALRGRHSEALPRRRARVGREVCETPRPHGSIASRTVPYLHGVFYESTRPVQYTCDDLFKSASPRIARAIRANVSDLLLGVYSERVRWRWHANKQQI